MTINEGMAAGRPILASAAVGAAEDLIQPGVTGWIAAADDVRCFRDQLLLSAEVGQATRR